MNENAQTFWKELQQSLNNYWQGFIHILPRLALAVLLLIVVLFLASRLSRVLGNRLSGKAHDPLFSNFVSKLIKFAVIIVGIILTLQVLGLSGVAGGLLAGAGISAFIIGFAFKDIAENFLAGIILAFNRPFALDDTIRIQDHAGHVKALNFRTTHLKTFDEKDVFIPNAIVLKEVVTNLTRDGLIRLEFIVGIAYEDNIQSAIDLILSTIEKNPEVLKDKKPFVVVEELATNTVNLRVLFWTATDDYKKGVLLTKSSVMQMVKEELSDKGFTLPANIVEMKLYDKRQSLPIELLGQKTSE
jgi:small-conductance mechanosensitive channel